MRVLSAALALALVFAFTPFVHAEDKAADASGTKSVTGTIVKVSGHKLTVSITSKKGKVKERQVKVDDKTKITLDGAQVKLSDLKKDQQVTLTLDHHLATEIAATSAAQSGAGTAGAAENTPKQ